MTDINGNKITIGDSVIWYDPDIEHRDTSRIYTVDHIKGDIISISDDYSEAEVFAKEIKIV